MTINIPEKILVEDPDTRVLRHDGATFIARQCTVAHRVEVAAKIFRGSRSDIIPGTAHFFEHTPYSDRSQFQKAQSKGADIGAWTDYDEILFYGKYKSEDVEEALRAVVDPLLFNRVTDEILLRERDVILGEMAYMERWKSHEASEKLIKFFRESGGHSICGTVDDVKKIDLQDLIDFHGTHFIMENLVVAIEGPQDVDELMDALIKRFSLPRAQPQAVPEIQYYKGTIKEEKDVGYSEASLFFPFENLNSSLHALLAYHYANKCLNELSGKLYEELRFNQRATYGFFTATEHIGNCSFLCLPIVSTDSKTLLKGLDGAVAGLRNFIQSDDDLFRSILDAAIYDSEEAIKRNNLEYGAIKLIDRAVKMGKIPRFGSGLDVMRTLTFDNVRELFVPVIRGGCSLCYEGKSLVGLPSHEEIGQRLAEAMGGANPIRTARMNVTPRTGEHTAPDANGRHSKG